MPASVAVLGCGLIGASWTALFIHHGLDVRAWDPNEAARRQLAAQIGPLLAQLAELGTGADRPGRLHVQPTLRDAVSGIAWVQENAPENTALKQALYAEVEAVVAPDCVIASSTSAQTWTGLSQGLRCPDRFITAHPFNPPHLMPLVELYGPDRGTLARASAFYESLGRRVVVLKKDIPGHIAGRLSAALWREAVHLVAEGVADVADIDAALVAGPGLRWSVIGAHMAYHLGGGRGGIEHYLRHLGPSQRQRWESLGRPELSDDVCRRLIEGIAEEAAGRTIEQLEAERDRMLVRLLKERGREGD
ncbi:MAG: 3-hydroxyacyl-CoA dehydrogenase [Rhizobiaceae bacterium]|nr:3-hydroxyacyl-CoA dehydrogenase [Rhizobiaceae bacterium]